MAPPSGHDAAPGGEVENGPVRLVTRTSNAQKSALEKVNWLRERIERGEIIEIACAFVWDDGSCGNTRSNSENRFRMVGSIEWLKHTLLEDIDIA